MITWMQEFFGVGSRPFWEIMTNINSIPVIVLVISLVLWFHGTRLGLRLAFITIIGGFLIEILKVFLALPRPYFYDESVQPWRDTNGFGMPSGHAAGSVNLWGMLALSFRQGWLYGISGLIIVLVGLSRIYFGVHSLEQVVIGWIIGFALVLLVLRLEELTVRWFCAQGLLTQVAVALIPVLLLFGFIQIGAPTLEASFDVPAQWIERHQQAQLFEASLEGEAIDEFKELRLFDILEYEAVGQLLGLMSVSVIVARWGGFGEFSRRQQIANVLLGVVLIGGLIPLIDLIDDASFTAIPFWAGTLVVVALGVPWIGKRIAKD